MPPRRPLPVGGHVIGGMPASFGYVERTGAEALQVFVSNPRGWAPATPAPERDAAFRARAAELKLPLFVHAPYLVNFGSPTAATVENSARSVGAALSRAAALGARGVVVHAGSAVDPRHRERAMRQLRERLLPLLDGIADDGPLLLVEPTAGGGEALASRVGDLAEVFAVLEQHPRLGVCLDTCHAFAAGHDLASPGGVRSMLNELVRTVGRGRLKLLHANDSRDPVGSLRDRHANVGKGHIGLEAFGELFHHPATRDVPVLVETPGDLDGHRADIAALTGLRSR